MRAKTGKTSQQDFSEFFPENYIKRACKILKLISEESKLRIMLLLAKEGPRTVTEICETLDMNQPTLSHHLSLLRHADLVDTKRKGKHIFYDINESLWREMGKQFFDYLQKGNDIHFLGNSTDGTTMNIQRLLLVLFLSIIALALPVSSQEFSAERYEVTYFIEFGKILVDLEIHSEEPGTINLPLPIDARAITAQLDGEQIDPVLNDNILTIGKGDQKVLRVQYITESFLERDSFFATGDEAETERS